MAGTDGPVSPESVKDLIRYLRHEDETRDVRQQLGAAQILQNDLLPILVQYPEDKVLFDAVIRYGGGRFVARGDPVGAPCWAGVPHTPPLPHRLMVNLTQPALLCFGKVPADATSRHHFLQVLSYLQAYKEVRLPRDMLWAGGFAHVPLFMWGLCRLLPVRRCLWCSARSSTTSCSW